MNLAEERLHLWPSPRHYDRTLHRFCLSSPALFSLSPGFNIQRCSPQTLSESNSDGIQILILIFSFFHCVSKCRISSLETDSMRLFKCITSSLCQVTCSTLSSDASFPPFISFYRDQNIVPSVAELAATLFIGKFRDQDV